MKVIDFSSRFAMKNSKVPRFKSSKILKIMAPLTVMEPRVRSVKWVCFGERMRDCWPQKCECLQFLQIESPIVFLRGDMHKASIKI